MMRDHERIEELGREIDAQQLRRRREVRCQLEAAASKQRVSARDQ